MKVFIQSYDADIDCPVMIVSGEYISSIVKLYEAIGFSGKMILTVNAEDEIEAFADKWCLFYCNKFTPSIEFIDKYQDYKFIMNDTIDSSHGKNSISFHNTLFEEHHLEALADFTGINAFKGLRWDTINQLWINVGNAAIEVQHTNKELAIRFGNELAIWIFAGRPMRSKELIKTLFKTFCKKCADFIKNKKNNQSGKCNRCGCYINTNVTMYNKLALATTSCPKQLWTADIAVSEESIKGREVELFNKYVEIQKLEYPAQDGKSCDCQ